MLITILLVEQYPVVREGLKTILGRHEGFRVIGETGDGLEAIKLAASLYPNVLIVGDTISGLNSREVTRRVRQHVPRTRVIVLSRHANETYVHEALRSGATGYVLQTASVDELVQAVRDVVAGRRYLSSALSGRITEVQSQRARTGGLDPYETLTTREREILHLVAAGRTNTEMATALGISPRTVETHRAHLRQKLGLRTQADLIRYALQHGILLTEQ
jgi:two-component system response regulator NreC